MPKMNGAVKAAVVITLCAFVASLALPLFAG